MNDGRSRRSSRRVYEERTLDATPTKRVGDALVIKTALRRGGQHEASVVRPREPRLLEMESRPLLSIPTNDGCPLAAM